MLRVNLLKRFRISTRSTWLSALVICLSCLSGCGWKPPAGSVVDGDIAYLGEQRRIFDTGQAEGIVDLRNFRGAPNLYAIGPVAGLDGEITILDSKPHISKVADEMGTFAVDHTFNHHAIFLVWAQVEKWSEPLTIPASVDSYAALETFVRDAAIARGVDVLQPVAFRLEGTARSINWHINVDRTNGMPVTRDLFRQSKFPYVLQGENVDVFGVYTEKHAGIFLSQGLRIHIHFVSRDSDATGHVDAINPSGMHLSFPRTSVPQAVSGEPAVPK